MVARLAVYTYAVLLMLSLLLEQPVPLAPARSGEWYRFERHWRPFAAAGLQPLAAMHSSNTE